MLHNLETQFKRRVFSSVLKTLKTYSHDLVKEKKPIVVGVTGSVGKSSFLHILDSILYDELKTKTTFHGNSETGLPLEILGIRNWLKNYSSLNWLVILAITPFAYLLGKLTFDYELLIAEMGIDSSKPPKNMSYLLDIIKPQVGVFLTVSLAHAQQFAEELQLDSQDSQKILHAIAAEKGKIVTELDHQSTAIINIDSPFIKNLIPEIEATIISIGTSAEADFKLVNHQVSISQSSFIFSFNQTEHQLTLSGYILSQEYGLLFLAALAAATIFDVEILSSIKKIEERFSLPPGRMSLITGKNDSTILDSSYNSSPAALHSILDTVEKITVKGKKILILGDMRELGPLEEDAHLEIINRIEKIADTIILIGPLMKKYVFPNLKNQTKVYTAEKAKGVGELMVKNKLVNKDDLIVVKGSQNTIFLEEIVYELMADQDQAAILLCRQSKYWKKVKNSFFN